MGLSGTKDRETLYRKREKRLKVLQRNSIVAKGMIYLSIVAGPVYATALTVEALPKSGVQLVASLVALAITLFFLALFAIRWRRFNRPMSEDADLIPAPAVVRGRIWSKIEGVAGQMAISTDNVSLFVSPRDLTAAPSVVEKREKIALVVPLGFLKVLDGDPNAAQAMLEHEMAHIQQKDTHLWALTSVYWGVWARLMFPFLIAVWALSAAGIGAIVLHNWELKKKVAVLVAKAQKAEEKKYKAAMKKIGRARYFADKGQNASNQKLQRWWADEDDGITEWYLVSKYRISLFTPIISLAAQSILIMYLLLVFSAVRSLRRLSERTADTAVILYSDASALVLALERYGGLGARHRFFSLHPSPRRRLRWVQEQVGA